MLLQYFCHLGHTKSDFKNIVNIFIMLFHYYHHDIYIFHLKYLNILMQENDNMHHDLLQNISTNLKTKFYNFKSQL